MLDCSIIHEILVLVACHEFIDVCAQLIMTLSQERLLLLRDAGLVVTLTIAWFYPFFAGRFCRWAERWGERLAAHRVYVLLVVAALVIALRVSLLPVLKPPLPHVHDEFSYLLAADTFAHGRLTNPPHPMWIFFETFHVNQFPTYQSKYPPAQGGVLALGQILGHPWIGVILSVACLCAVISWALQGWVPAKWALLGGLLAFAQFGAVNYWMESYWGGAVAGIGGGLVLGAFPRILRRQKIRDALLFALGLALLANSRPFEGLVFSLVIIVALGWSIMRRHDLGWRRTIQRFVAPAMIGLTLAGAFMAYYNWRSTGNPFLLPYVVNDRAYLSVPVFEWQKLGPPPRYINPQFQSFYDSQRTMWQGEHFDWTWHTAKTAFGAKLASFQEFYAPPQLAVPMIAAMWFGIHNRKVRFCLLIMVLVVAGLLCARWFFPHYVAPSIATLYLLMVLGFRYLRRWRFRGRSVGIGITRALVAFQALLFAAQIGAFAVLIHGRHRDGGWAETRAEIEARLTSMPGQHLVLVDYSPQHNPNQEWVYNQAQIDRAKIVWAREIPGRGLQPLLDYFRGRRLWIVKPDAISGPELQPFSSADISARILYACSPGKPPTASQ